jgi:hypothetical protein
MLNQLLLHIRKQAVTQWNGKDYCHYVSYTGLLELSFSQLYYDEYDLLHCKAIQFGDSSVAAYF